MAAYSRKDYIHRLGVKPKNGVYIFIFDEGDEVHDQLIGDLSMEFDFDAPNDGDTVYISVNKSKEVTAVSVVRKSGGRSTRSRLHKKTRRSKRKRGYTKRR